MHSGQARKEVSRKLRCNIALKRMCTELILMIVRALGVTSDFFLPEAITCRGDPESGSPDLMRESYYFGSCRFHINLYDLVDTKTLF